MERSFLFEDNRWFALRQVFREGVFIIAFHALFL